MIRDDIFPTDYVNSQRALTYKHFRLQATQCRTDGVKNQKASTHTYSFPQKPVSYLKETILTYLLIYLLHGAESFLRS